MDDLFEIRLVDQLTMLADYCHLFDLGRYVHGKSMSTRLFIMFHDMVKDPAWRTIGGTLKLTLISTSAPHDPNNLIVSHHPLTAVGVGPRGIGFTAVGSNALDARLLKVSKWWEEEVTRLDSGRRLSRKNLVYQLRNKDGGSHGYAERPSDDYSAIREQDGGYSAEVSGQPVPMTVGPIEATIRQIAHEALCSLLPYISASRQGGISYSNRWSPMGSTNPEFMALATREI